jgi:RNA polymerase sigma factor (TIGR02999 family)
MPVHPGEVTQLLIDLRQGSQQAEEKLIPLVYGELRQLAAHYMRAERPGHSLQPTALVHEAYLRLTYMKETNWQGRAHFFAVSAQLMRRILVDHARVHHAQKRGGLAQIVSFDEAIDAPIATSEQLLALDQALDCLAELDPRQARIVELRFFAGLTEEETGQVLGISARTVKRDWRVAKAWLFRQLNEKPAI